MQLGSGAIKQLLGFSAFSLWTPSHGNNTNENTNNNTITNTNKIQIQIQIQIRIQIQIQTNKTQMQIQIKQLLGRAFSLWTRPASHGNKKTQSGLFIFSPISIISFLLFCLFDTVSHEMKTF